MNASVSATGGQDPGATALGEMGWAAGSQIPEERNLKSVPREQRGNSWPLAREGHKGLVWKLQPQEGT